MKVFDDSATYTQAEAAPKLRKSKSWFERSRWAGNGPRYIKVGRSVLYLGKDLNAWLESQARSNTGQEA
jgi:hypothetical protein